jgi:CheY-like chemotaxis protein
MNLAVNARDAMPGGGRLTIETANVQVDEAAGPRPYVMLAVTDTGIGMTPDIQARIFEPYFTTKEVGEGSGLGLSVVHGIVAGLGGSISVRTEPGKGSCFEVLLPRLPDTATLPSAPVGPPRTPTTEIVSVLLVDDEPGVLQVHRSMLESLGHRVTATTDSLDALRLFREDPSAFDLVVTDQTLPHLSGASLSRELLKLRPGVPIILCTGYSDALDEPTALALGARALLNKPFGRDELAQALARFLRPQ